MSHDELLELRAMISCLAANANTPYYPIYIGIYAHMFLLLANDGNRVAVRGHIIRGAGGRAGLSRRPFLLRAGGATRRAKWLAAFPLQIPHRHETRALGGILLRQ